jgi:glucosamine kinase
MRESYRSPRRFANECNGRRLSHVALTVLGIDIGGTKSRARLWAEGRVAAEHEAASASLAAAGLEAAGAALAELLAGLPLDRSAPLDAICAGTAGLSVPGTAEFLRERLSPLTHGTVLIVRDAMLVLPAAGIDEGVAVICGTGSVAVGAYRDRTVQVGGWGYLLGDEGGGYWMVREALRILLDRRDRGEPLGDLGARLLAAAGAADLPGLLRLYYEQPHVPRRWARYAAAVVGGTDPAAGDLLAGAADAVTSLAVSAMRDLDAPAALPVVLAGGLSGNAAFLDAARRAVAAALPGSTVRVLADPPVAGAVRLARQAATRAQAGPSHAGPSHADPTHREER